MANLMKKLRRNGKNTRRSSSNFQSKQIRIHGFTMNTKQIFYQETKRILRNMFSLIHTCTLPLLQHLQNLFSLLRPPFLAPSNFHIHDHQFAVHADKLDKNCVHPIKRIFPHQISRSTCVINSVYKTTT